MKKKFSTLLAILLIYAMMAPMTMATTMAELDQQHYANLGSETTSVYQATVGKGTLIDPSLSAVWKIKFPTADAVSYIVDPQHVAYQGNLNGLQYAMDSSATVLFTQYDAYGTATGMGNKTGEIAVVNEGTVDVVVELNVRPTSTSMKLHESSAVIDSSETDASIGFLMDTSSSVATSGTPIRAVGQNMSSEVNANLNNFTPVVTQDPNNKEKITVNWGTGFETDTSPWNKASFYFYGQVNEAPDKVNWAGKTAPDLKLSWNVRSKAAEAIAIDTALLASENGYTVEADRLTAVPGDTVTLYFNPADGHKNDILMQPTDDNAKVFMTMTTRNYTLGDDAENEMKYNITNFALGDPVKVENGLWAVSFKVPDKSSAQGFTLVKRSSAAATANYNGVNKIEFTGPFGFKDVTLSSEFASNSVASSSWATT